MPAAQDRPGSTEALLARAQDVLAYGGVYSVLEQVVSYPGGEFPQFAAQAQGCRIQDTNGKWYIDWRNGWGSVVLGHRRAEIEAAIIEQLRAGPKPSLMHPLEIEVAEQIRAMVPCAEQVAFGKNGSDATLAAVRLARACTGRDVLLQSGYHGFHDWYKGLQSSCEGIPQAVRELTASFPFNDFKALEQLFARYQGRVAAVILEPATTTEPDPGYLEAVKTLVHSQGALLIFDEVITGFRLARGGGQELYGVIPDLACLGKALSNGMPLSAVVGRREFMQVLPRTGFTMTYQGETLSLAAARATLRIHELEPVSEHLARVGTRLRERFEQACRELGVAAMLAGPPARMQFFFAPVGVLTPLGLLKLFLQECLKRGILTEGKLLPSYAHDEEAIERTAVGVHESLQVVRNALEAQSLERFLNIPCEPAFYRRDGQALSRVGSTPKMGLLHQTFELGRNWVRPLLHSARQVFKKHPAAVKLFDEAYYLEQSPDVRAAGAIPLLHYLECGGREGRNPNLLFDGQYYLEHNPDVKASGQNPLLHYLASGGSEGRSPHPLFEGRYYLHQYPDVRKSGINPLIHYLESGGSEGRNPHPLFDGSYYLEQHADVQEAGLNPLVHYLRLGGLEGRNPHILFDGKLYLEENPEVLSRRMNPLVHFLTIKQRQLANRLASVQDQHQHVTRLFEDRFGHEPDQDQLYLWSGLVASGLTSWDSIEQHLLKVRG